MADLTDSLRDSLRRVRHLIKHDICVGDKIKVYYGKGNISNVLYHVRGTIDGRVVVRRWLRTKRRWHYELLDDVWFVVFMSVDKPVAKVVKAR